MTLGEALPAGGGRLPPPEIRDQNLSLLEDRLAAGFAVVGATPIEAGVGAWPGPCWQFELDRDGATESVLVWPGHRAMALFAERLAQVPVLGSGPAAAEAVAAPGGLPAALKAAIDTSSDLPPEEKAAVLMDWIMEKVEASRCALVPYHAGTPGNALAFHLRGQAAGTADLTHIPRQILAHVSRSRQPVVSHNVGQPGGLPATGTLVDQRVASYMAVPVIFRGELLAVCYVDRFDRPRRFSDEEQASFEAFAYELSTPLLGLLEQRRRSEYRALRDSLLGPKRRGDGLVASPGLESVLGQARRLAPHRDQGILLLGETGVGKEMVARYIHEHSGPADRPFVPVNISAIQPELFEAELMGSVRGAFTGAVDRPGRIAEAEGGSFFLDEIGDLSLANQVRLLRFLQDKMVRRVGGKGEHPADVRIIAATNRPLARMMEVGEFRRDLYHRFASALRIPPLRERREEIEPLTDAWLGEESRRRGLRSPRLTASARAFLMGYAWPGNVRQLKAVLSHALLLADGPEIDRPALATLCSAAADDGAAVAIDSAPPEAVPEGPQSRSETWDEFRARQDDVERRWLSAVLARHDNKVAPAARALGCAVTTLRSVLQRHNLLPRSG